MEEEKIIPRDFIHCTTIHYCTSCYYGNDKNSNITETCPKREELLKIHKQFSEFNPPE